MDVPFFRIKDTNGDNLYVVEGVGNLNETEFQTYKQQLGTYGRLVGPAGDILSEAQQAKADSIIQSQIEDAMLDLYPDDWNKAIIEAELAFKEYKKPGYKKRMAGDEAFAELLAKAGAETDSFLWTESDELAMQKERLMIADMERYGGKENVPYNPDKLFRPGSRSITAEQKRNHQIFHTGKAPKYAPYDNFTAEDMNYRPERPGIDGEYQPGSRVRVHTQYGFNDDPIMDDQPEIIRKNVWTEMPSQAGMDSLYEAYQQAAELHNRNPNRYFTESGSIEDFNRKLAEYYGQQGLLLAGNTPVADKDRSPGVLKREKKGEATAVGTNRLIEQTKGMNDSEGFFEKDYRYINKNGKIIVGDSQTLPAANDRGNIVYGDIFNAARLDPSLTDNRAEGLLNVLMDKAAEIRSRGEGGGMDLAIKELMDEGVLPPIKSVGAIKSGGEQGVALGKSTGKSPLFGSVSVPNQRELDEIVFSELPSNFRTKIGVKPINMTIVDTDGMNQAMIDPTILTDSNFEHYLINNITEANQNRPVSQRDQKGKTRLKMNTRRLAGQGIAKRLLPPDLMRQLR